MGQRLTTPQSSDKFPGPVSHPPFNNFLITVTEPPSHLSSQSVPDFSSCLLPLILHSGSGWIFWSSAQITVLPAQKPSVAPLYLQKEIHTHNLTLGVFYNMPPITLPIYFPHFPPHQPSSRVKLNSLQFSTSKHFPFLTLLMARL